MKRVPASHYTSPDRLALELEHVFETAWLLAVHASELQEPGSFEVVDVAEQSVLMTRTEDGSIRAHHNVCQHRGTRLCAAARGRADSLRCPYHHWEYALDGRLIRAPGAGAVATSESGEPLALAPIRCAERFGFVWVSLAPEPVDIDEYLAPVAPELERYAPEEYRLKNATTVDVDANWKASCDVNNEGYHLPMLHPQLLEVADVRTARFELRGDHSVQSLVLGRPSRDVDANEPVSEALSGLLASFGAEPVSTVGDVPAAMVGAFRARAQRLGADLSSLSDEALTMKQQVHVFPNVQLNFLPFSLEVYRHRPHPRDPGRCYFDEHAYVRTGSEPAPDATRLNIRHGERSLGPVMDADVDLLPRLQAGMRSSGFSELRLVDSEGCIAHMHDVLDAWLARGEAERC